MSIKEEIHALTDEMLANLGRLVAIDSQLGTPAEGMPFGESLSECGRRSGLRQPNEGKIYRKVGLADCGNDFSDTL